MSKDGDVFFLAHLPRFVSLDSDFFTYFFPFLIYLTVPKGFAQGWQRIEQNYDQS